MRDDIFEEDMFEEETNDTASGLDDDSQHVYELMQKGLAYMDEAVHYIDKMIKINNIFDENITGVPTASLEQMKKVYSEMLPNLIVGDTELLIATTQRALNTTEKVAREFIEEKQATLLENIDNNSNNNI